MYLFRNRGEFEEKLSSVARRAQIPPPPTGAGLHPGSPLASAFRLRVAPTELVYQAFSLLPSDVDVARRPPLPPLPPAAAAAVADCASKSPSPPHTPLTNEVARILGATAADVAEVLSHSAPSSSAAAGDVPRTVLIAGEPHVLLLVGEHDVRCLAFDT